MKKTVLLFVLISSVSIKLFAQGPVPNSGFENWVSYATGTTPTYPYELPTGWRTTDSITVANSAGTTHSASREMSSVHAGSFALNLQTWSYMVGPFPVLTGISGCATNGDVFVDVGTATILPISGSPDTVRHAHLNGYYTYTAGGSGLDSGSIEICLYKRNTSTGNRDTAALGIYYFHNQSSYTAFSVTISQYGSTAITPDSMLIWIQSSPREPLGSGQTGSVLRIDDLSFSGVIGIHEIPDVVNAVSIFPVPAGNELNIVLDLKKNIHTSFEVVDITGKKMLIHDMKTLKENVNITELSNGSYFYNLLDEQGVKLRSGKFIVNK